MYVIVVRFVSTVLGNVLIWSGTIFYPVYEAGDTAHGISPLTDQGIAGAIMMGEGMIVSLVVLSWSSSSGPRTPPSASASSISQKRRASSSTRRVPRAPWRRGSRSASRSDSGGASPKSRGPRGPARGRLTSDSAAKLPAMPEQPRLRRTSIAIIVLASVIAFFAVFAVWAKRQILETNTWTETSTELLANKEVQGALNTFLVDALFKEVNVEHQIKKALPDNLQGLAGPAAGGVHELAGRASLQALQSPTFQNLWAQANAKAHDAFLQIIEGGNTTLSTQGGVVNLDLGRVVTQVAQNAGVDIKGKVPPGREDRAAPLRRARRSAGRGERAQGTWT